MREKLIEAFVNSAEKIASNSNMTKEEFNYALALLIMGQMQHQNNNPMDIVMSHDMTLRLGLLVNPVTKNVEDTESYSRH